MYGRLLCHFVNCRQTASVAKMVNNTKQEKCFSLNHCARLFDAGNAVVAAVSAIVVVVVVVVDSFKREIGGFWSVNCLYKPLNVTTLKRAYTNKTG